MRIKRRGTGPAPELWRMIFDDWNVLLRGLPIVVERVLAVSIVACLPLSGAFAENEKVLPLQPPAALLVDDAGDRQAAVAEKFGQVSIQEIALANKIAASDSSLASVRQHAKFDFYMIPIRFGVLGFDGKTCRWMQFGATLRAPGTEPGQVFILNVFPAASIKKGDVSADGKLSISSDLKVATPQAAPAAGEISVGGEANLTWTWNPVYQHVASVHDQTRAIWRFDAVGSEFPVGQVQVATIVAVAKSLSSGQKPRLGLDVEMRANFGGGWFDAGGLARANSTIVIRLP